MPHKDSMRAAIHLCIRLFVLLSACGPCLADGLLNLKQPGLGLPWGVPESEVSRKLTSLGAGPVNRAYEYQGSLGIGDLTSSKRLIFTKFDRTGGLSGLSFSVPSDDIIRIVRHLQNSLGQGRTASYPDSRVFQRLYEWVGKDFAIELSYTALSADPLGAPAKGDLTGRVAIKRELSRPSELDRALDYPKVVENLRQQMLAAAMKQEQERAARKQKEAAQKPLSACELASKAHQAVTYDAAVAEGSKIARLTAGALAPLASAYARVSDPLFAVEVSEQGCAIAVGHRSGAVELWRGCNAPKRFDLPKHYASAEHFTFSRSGHRLITSAHAEVATVWDVSSDREIAAIGDVTGQTAITPDDRYAIVTTRTGGTRLFDLKTNKLAGEPWTVGQSSTAIAANNIDLIAVGTASGDIHMLQLYRNDGPLLCLQRSIRAYEMADWVQALAFLPGGRLASVSRSGKVDTWDTATGTAVASTQLELRYVRRARVFSPGLVLAAGTLVPGGDESFRVESRSLTSPTGLTAPLANNIADVAFVPSMNVLLLTEFDALRLLPYSSLAPKR